MAARRLVIVMVVLLVASTAAAQLVPAPEPSGEPTRSTTTEEATPPSQRGAVVSAIVKADAEGVEKVRVPVGDQLSLEVRSRRAGEIEIRRLGLLEDVAPLSPARFDILVRSEGRYEVRRIQPRERLALLVFALDERASGSGRRAGRSAGTSR
jgi:hypothetical protein